MAEEMKVPDVNQAEMNELLKILLAEKAKEAKEKQEKEAKEQAERLANINSQIEAAKARNEQLKIARESCPHQTINPANGNRRSAWRAQVNSDGCFVPVCCLCQTVMPKIKATDEQKKEGVGLDRYVELPLNALEKWHKVSFESNCDNPTCYVCHPVQEAVLA